MEAVQRSTSAAGSMSDPFHVGSTSDPFGVPRAADPHRTGGGGSVFGGTSPSASAVAAVGIAGGDSRTVSTVADALRQATGGPGGDAVSRAFESDGSDTLRGGPGGRSDGSVFRDIRRDDIQPFANNTPDSSLTSYTASPRDDAPLSDGQIPGDRTFGTRLARDDSRAVEVTSLRSEDDAAMAAVSDTQVPTPPVALAGDSADEIGPLPATFDANDGRASTATTDDRTPLRAQTPDAAASATSAEHVIAAPHADSASATATPAVTVEDADTRVADATPVAEDIRVPVHGDTSTPVGSAASAQRVDIASLTDSATNPEQPEVTTERNDARAPHATTGEIAAHQPARDDVASHGAAVSDDRGALAPVSAHAPDAAAPGTPTMSGGSATVDRGSDMAGASPRPPVEDDHTLSADHRGAQPSESIDPSSVAAIPVHRNTHRDDIETDSVSESQRNAEQVIDVVDETHRRTARVTVSTDVVPGATQDMPGKEAAPSEPVARPSVATHMAMPSPAPDDAAPRASSSDMRTAQTQGAAASAEDARASTSVPARASADDADRAPPRSATAGQAASEPPRAEVPETDASDDEPPAERP